jgi:methyl-accepting chemotaxis protein PixJ
MNTPAKPRDRQPLQKRLLFTILPTVILPLLIAGGLGFASSRERGRNSELERLQSGAFSTRQATASFLNAKLSSIKVYVQNPDVQALIKQGDTLVRSENLAQLPDNVLEERFKQSRLLAPSAAVNQSLNRFATTEVLSEVFFTDRNGFNLAAGGKTSDFVQRDEDWWRTAKNFQTAIDAPKFDESANSVLFAISQSIVSAENGEFLGVLKAGIDADILTQTLRSYTQRNFNKSEVVQLVDGSTGRPITSLTQKGHEENSKLQGGEPLAQFLNALVKMTPGDLTTKPNAEIQKYVQDQAKDLNLMDVKVQPQADGVSLSILAKVGDRYYQMQTLPRTNWIVVSSETEAEVNAASQDLLKLFAGVSVLLSLVASGVVVLLARQLAKPLVNLTETAKKVTGGDLSIRAELEGTSETQTLGQGLNRLLDQVQTLLVEQKSAAENQRQQREDLEQDVVQLMEDIGDAAEGDLTVRAQLSPGDVGIVADLFNSIIENLRDTAFQVKGASGQVETSLDANAQSIRQLATQAIVEAQSLRQILSSVEEMSGAIETVAQSAETAAQLTDETYNTVQDGTQFMDQSVQSIQNLRSTVGETAKKIKRLGESAQRISQTVSLIDEITLKTNLLAVNASVEAARAGELGQGFTAVAEQVGALAEQSAAATQEIAQIVADIQAETQEVVAAIETGTAQVIDSTQLVEATKAKLASVLARSEQVNQLMRSISGATTAQTATSAKVSERVKAATIESEQRSQASEQMAQAIQDTAKIARSLQASVAQFKVEESANIQDTVNELLAQEGPLAANLGGTGVDLTQSKVEAS